MLQWFGRFGKYCLSLRQKGSNHIQRETTQPLSIMGEERRVGANVHKYINVTNKENTSILKPWKRNNKRQTPAKSTTGIKKNMILQD